LGFRKGEKGKGEEEAVDFTTSSLATKRREGKVLSRGKFLGNVFVVTTTMFRSTQNWKKPNSHFIPNKVTRSSFLSAM